MLYVAFWYHSVILIIQILLPTTILFIDKASIHIDQSTSNQLGKIISSRTKRI